MAWFLNHYRCARCGHEWTDEWSCGCDDDCPECSARHMSPAKSDDLTFAVEKCGAAFAVLFSPPDAGHHADYVEVAEFMSQHAAELYIEAVLRPQRA